MSNVKWLKFNPDFLDGASFKFMRRAKVDGVADLRDKLEAIWWELLGLAGKINNQGWFQNDEMAYNTFEDIAVMLDRTPKEIEICMKFYVKYKMVSIVDDCYMLNNFTKYQNVKGLEEIREKNRIRQAKYRQRNSIKKLRNVTQTLHNVTVTPLDIDKDIELDKDIDIEKNTTKKENTLKEKKKANGKNIPPTLEEVKKYIKDNYMLVDGEKFFNYYGSNGWYVGKTKMKNWHYALATWEKNIKSKNPAEYEKLIADLKRPHYIVNKHDYRNPNTLIMCEFKERPNEVVKALSEHYSKDQIKKMVEYDLKINVDSEFKPIESKNEEKSINIPEDKNIALDVSKLVKKVEGD